MTIKNLRPTEAAQALGIGLSTFWKKAKSDPDFPRLISLGPRTTVVEEKDLQTYMQKFRERGHAAQKKVAAAAGSEAVAA